MNGLSAGRGERLPHLRRRSRFAAVITHHAHGLFDQFEVARLCPERRILKADANMAAAPDRLGDQGADIGADDARVNLPVVGLRAAAVIGMDVNDGGAGAGAGDPFGDDGLDRIGTARLQPPFSAASIQTFRTLLRSRKFGLAIYGGMYSNQPYPIFGSKQTPPRALADACK
jgi:hypothetical protein